MRRGGRGEERRGWVREGLCFSLSTGLVSISSVSGARKREGEGVGAEWVRVLLIERCTPTSGKSTPLAAKSVATRTTSSSSSSSDIASIASSLSSSETSR